MHVVSGGDIIKKYSGTDRTFERAIQARGPTARVERLARVVTWHGMALVDGDGIFRIRFDHAHLSQFGRQPPKLGVARSNRARVTTAPPRIPLRSPKASAADLSGRDSP